MSAEVIEFKSATQPIAHFIRVDDSHRRFGDLDSLKRRLSEHHRKIGKFSDTLSPLHDERGAGAPRAMTCRYRTGGC